ncbi:terminase small subunit [Roseomonas sp. USHLN139]|uniref:terminase small subunit n=1 Tax=Roseomonas sp. USHLN139 TaxID=3081298 RepID=UPI003B015EC6
MSVLVNKSELAEILGISLPTLNDWIKKDPSFPVEVRGSNGVEWQFDPSAVLEHRQQVQQAEIEAARQRQAVIEQYRLPLAGPVDSGSDGKFTPQQELALVRKRQLEMDMAKEAGFLVESTKVRMVLRTAINQLNRSFQGLPSQVGRQFNLPEATVRAMRDHLEDYQRNLVRGLRELMDEPEPENGDRGSAVRLSAEADLGGA